ncbi:hypothetical protein Trydic_g23324 [Trypoxylus dichotomus]
MPARMIPELQIATRKEWGTLAQPMSSKCETSSVGFDIGAKRNVLTMSENKCVSIRESAQIEYCAIYDRLNIQFPVIELDPPSPSKEFLAKLLGI